MIDLRSDTVTRPSAAMRAAMADADVGDDVYGEDPTVNALEARAAEVLGVDDAVFVPTGTMANQIALRVHAEHGDLVLAHEHAHIVRNEVGAAAALAGVTFRAVRSADGQFGADAVADAVERAHPFNPTHLSPRLRLVCVENTHNAAGGTVWSVPRLRSVAAAAAENGLATHMDGARIWHAAEAEGVGPGALTQGFDTVSACFSKGLGAPAGSVLAGHRDLVARARRFKQQYGGGWRQAGILAAAALHALEHHRATLDRDLASAARFARALAGMAGVRVDLDSVQSNIVRFEVTSCDAASFVEACHAQGVHMLPGGARGVRAVFHRDVSSDDVDRALECVASVMHAGVGAAPVPGGRT